MNGFRRHYEDHGRGELVVFFHDFTLDDHMWDRQRGLAKKYRVIVADMRFHGRSEAPEGSTFTLAEAADDVRGLARSSEDQPGLPGRPVAGWWLRAGDGGPVPGAHPDLAPASPSIQGIKTPPDAMAAFMKGVEAYPKEGAAPSQHGTARAVQPRRRGFPEHQRLAMTRPERPAFVLAGLLAGTGGIGQAADAPPPPGWYSTSGLGS